MDQVVCTGECGRRTEAGRSINHTSMDQVVRTEEIILRTGEGYMVYIWI